MIIKQRQTFADPLLLKVIYPFLERTNHRQLIQISKYWNSEVVEPDQDPKNESTFAQWLEATNGESWWQRIADTVNRWLEPQSLEPVPVPVRIDDDHRRRMRQKR